MTALLAILSIILIAIIAVQIGKVTELAAKIRGEEEVEEMNNKRTSYWLVVFMVVFLVACVWSAAYYKNYMLGYGPHESASVHGASLDWTFKVTLFFTGIVFFLTQIALFWFSYKYRAERGRKATFLSHSNKLEIIWTAIPAVVMTLLVVGGLDVWNEVMADVSPDEEYMEIEATGYQFAWQLRYPGADAKLGTRDYKLTTGTNPLGQDWTDAKNWDDIHPGEIVLPVGKKVRVRITARDVLHDFYLPHFRVKMDAVPGMPTYFVFTPNKTTEEYRQELKEYPEYNVPDPNDPTKMLWETFEYELACAELCGSGHWSMKRLVKIVTQDEYDTWLKAQQSYYLSTIRNTDDDPLKGQVLDFEIKERKKAFSDALEAALKADSAAAKVIQLKYVEFETGSAALTDLSRYELDNLAGAMKANAGLKIELGGHTDNIGEPAANLTLSQQRAESVMRYLVSNGVDASRLSARGYGDTRPKATNDTDEGKAQNRRTEFTIKAQ